MKINKSIGLIFIMVLVFGACTQPKVTTEVIVEEEKVASNWKTDLEAKLKLYGHRNWIVVADGAYPQQSNPAIETITIDASQLEAVKYVSNLIADATHVDANIFVDKEMAFVSEKNAKGITAYRDDLNKILNGKPFRTMLHEDIISELDASAKLFNVLIIKTDLAIPYTSVFFQLECGYWNGDSEAELREVLKE
ncbi:RbsD/FucU domain-containing protein [Aureibaculum conchae]|uniref:RbsD/FucU domain-containing protein n=1 Tax=Aureibaculum sp. 2308TA14-22 TaxID=3108392 RepID=UPI00339107F2